jgi:hypothetical protein
LKRIDVTKIAAPPMRSPYWNTGSSTKFNYPRAVNTAAGYAGGGALTGGALGCVAGILIGGTIGLSTGPGAIIGAGAGCMVYGASGAAAGGLVGPPTGFILGGHDLPGADAFDWMPSDFINMWRH